MGVVLPHHSNSGLLLPGQIRSTPARYFAVPDGLVGYWGFDPDCMDGTTAVDLSGNGNNGTVFGTSNRLTAGQIGTAFLFDGATDVAIPNSNSLNIAGALTIACWCNPTALPSGSDFAFLVSKADTGSNYKMLIDGPDNGGAIRYEFLISQSGSNVICVDTTTTPVTGRWVFLVGTYDLAHMCFYTNAQLKTSQAQTGPIDTAANPLYIGQNALSFPAYFNGAIDDVRIYNRALDANEVMLLYHAGLAGQRHSSLIIPEDAEMDAFLLAAATPWTPVNQVRRNWLTRKSLG